MDPELSKQEQSPVNTDPEEFQKEKSRSLLRGVRRGLQNYRNAQLNRAQPETLEQFKTEMIDARRKLREFLDDLMEETYKDMPSDNLSPTEKLSLMLTHILEWTTKHTTLWRALDRAVEEQIQEDEERRRAEVREREKAEQSRETSNLKKAKKGTDELELEGDEEDDDWELVTAEDAEFPTPGDPEIVTSGDQDYVSVGRGVGTWDAVVTKEIRKWR